MKIVTNVGYCRFCNEGRVIEVPEGTTQDDWNEIATEDCDCYMAQDAKKKRYQKEACLANIQKMLVENRPEIAEIFETCIDALQERKIKKITINTYGNFTVKMHMNKDGIKIEIEKKLKEENLA